MKTPAEIIKETLDKIIEMKPNDRSEKDRHYQILITDLEKQLAYALVYLKGE